jgi:hypothetical protein
MDKKTDKKGVKMKKPLIGEYTFSGFVDTKGYQRAMDVYNLDRIAPYAEIVFILTVAAGLIIGWTHYGDGWIHKHAAKIIHARMVSAAAQDSRSGPGGQDSRSGPGGQGSKKGE